MIKAVRGGTGGSTVWIPLGRYSRVWLFHTENLSFFAVNMEPLTPYLLLLGIVVPSEISVGPGFHTSKSIWSLKQEETEYFESHMAVKWIFTSLWEWTESFILTRERYNMQCQQHCLKHPGDSWAEASWTAVIRYYRNVRSKYSGSQITGLLTGWQRGNTILLSDAIRILKHKMSHSGYINVCGSIMKKS